VQANPGAPLFLTVVAVDAAGNGAVYEDARPVFLDGTAPLPGYVLDGALLGFVGNAKLSTTPHEWPPIMRICRERSIYRILPTIEIANLCKRRIHFEQQTIPFYTC
jgi:hypothetical protein